MNLPFWFDANVLIEAKNRWYPFSLVPNFWRNIGEEIERGSIRCPKAVFDEIVSDKEKEDQLARWVRARKSFGLCVLPTSPIQDNYREIADYLSSKHSRYQLEEFLTGADLWLIATAKVLGGTVVTGESKSRKRKIRVPTVCREFDVPHAELFDVVHYFNRPLT
jgi:hypothetical protein